MDFKHPTYRYVQLIYRALPPAMQQRLGNLRRRYVSHHSSNATAHAEHLAAQPPDRLAQEMAAQHDVSLAFAKAYIQHSGLAAYERHSLPQMLASISPLSQMYVDFALSTTARGKQVANRMAFALQADKRSLQGLRYLDIGTAYAGFLRAFVAQGCRQAIGIELNPALVALGRANVQDMPAAQVLQHDIDTRALQTEQTLGHFDVITCNDVIEHVKQPAAVIEKICQATLPGGLAYMEIPNKDSLAFILEDGHFKLFGVTQFERDDAADYYAQLLGEPAQNYLHEMGWSYDLDWYQAQFAQHSMTAEITPQQSFSSMSEVPGWIEKIQAQLHALQTRSGHFAKLTEANAQRNAACITRYLEELQTQFATATDAADAASIKRFSMRYLCNFWSLTARKP
jgi:2-polyprenyl-3-methyl-5-hydroxy-6-metoxy-1,4-benzoquinol methylase